MTEEARESLADFKATKEGHKRRAQENIGQPKGRIIKAKKGFFEKLKGKHGGEVSGT